MPTSLKLLMLTATVLLAGCSGPYEIKFNDRVVYDPFADPDQAGKPVLADAGLQACLNERLDRNPEASAEAITLLACSGAGITSLDGIRALPALEQLELSDNAISDLTPLAPLSKLRVLSIRNNRIRDVRTLRDMPLLRFITLTGNDGIPCNQLNELEARAGSGLTRPALCRQ